MSTSTIPAFLDALADALAALPALASASVFSAPAGDSRPRVAIELGMDSDGNDEIEMNDAPMTMNGQRVEEYAVPGWTYATDPRAGETGIRAARDAAFALYAAVETYLNDYPTVGGTCVDADLERGKIRQPYGPEGHACFIDFTIRVRATKNP